MVEEWDWDEREERIDSTQQQWEDDWDDDNVNDDFSLQLKTEPESNAEKSYVHKTSIHACDSVDNQALSFRNYKTVVFTVLA
ncbi:hypothetical protein D8674_018288 [Pyrus ussuriensis x Pyrus communis]|uniref:26S proteasome complex subunit SEM1 n=1 Tax=Pyrus ussuriensis x Pyrus communis TaxID=2448454 RepID=A0A5N5G4D6_9ROSA|nr:hypothetical protein D8674_018288 [Pyrus ussuriensis x Pyrus communis]